MAIRHALITRLSLILADEPTGNLDTKNSSEVIALLKGASWKNEQTVLMITHSKKALLRLPTVFCRCPTGCSPILGDAGSKTQSQPDPHLR